MIETPQLDEQISKENFVIDDNVYILGQFDRSISQDVIPALVQLIQLKRGEKDPIIQIYINSPGGYATELFGLLSILQMAKSSGISIITHNIGIAYSCASILAVFGDYRTMSRYADNVAHLGTCGIEFNTFKQLDRENTYSKKYLNKILDIYAEHTKLSKKELEDLMSDDKLHLDPKQCLKAGFCDKII